MGPDQLAKAQQPVGPTADLQAFKAWDKFLEAKEAFRQSLQTSAPQGYKVYFSEKYNKLEIGLGKGIAQAPVAKAPSQVEFLQARVVG